MVSNKKRLYVALYPSGTLGSEERRYHWAFLVGPKDGAGDSTRGTRYHVKNLPTARWVYEELETEDVRWTNNLLARVVVAKIEDERRLVDVIRNTPVVQGDSNWRCSSWIADVLARLELDGKAVGTAKLGWADIEPKARAYVAEKCAAGRYATVEELKKLKPTWDLLTGKEILP